MEEIFEVNEEVVVGDLTDVKQERDLLPPSKGVRLRIKKANVNENKDKTYRSINLQLILEEGIQIGDTLKYKGKVVFAKVCYYADLENGYSIKMHKKYGEMDFFKKRQHLVQLKFLCGALGEDLASVRINDGFLSSLNGRVLIGNIVQKPNNYTAPNGEQVSEIQNDVINFKKAPDLL